MWMTFMQLFIIVTICVPILKILTSALEETSLKMNLLIKQIGRWCHFTFQFHQRIPVLNVIKIRKYNNVFIYLNLEFHVQFKIPEQFEDGDSLLSFGAESFIFQFTVKKHKDQDTQNCNFASCFVWVWSLVSYIEGGTQGKGVQEVLRKVFGPKRD
jgi:hypothetical protein